MKKNSSILISPFRQAIYYILVSVLFLLNSCEKIKAGVNESATEINPDSLMGLKDYYKEFFPVGVAVTPASLTGQQSVLILKHFKSLTLLTRDYSQDINTLRQISIFNIFRIFTVCRAN